MPSGTWVVLQILLLNFDQQDGNMRCWLSTLRPELLAIVDKTAMRYVGGLLIR
jgi:hypothetical protein